ncbi:MAG: hypothetical protein ACXW1W_18240 [Methylococcaceae bacterium]
MKNRILIISVLILSTGCASLRYPNWENIHIESCVHNMPCVSKGIKEKCDQSYGCDDWFKKRATLVNANTVVIDSIATTATYFQCETGLPIYKDKEHKEYNFKFNEEEYKPYHESGTNTVTGQAFLTQSGGGVVTCAGQSVLMHPDAEYFNQRDSYMDSIAKECATSINDLDNAAKSFINSSQCDAQGNFEFHKVPAGNYVISVNVSWSVGYDKQGGIVRKKVTVRDGEINKFIISR